MAKCKFCGQGVRTAPVFHPACWEQRANKVMEEFCDKFTATFEDTVWYATNIEIYDYVTALRALELSADRTMVLNNSAMSVWLEVDGAPVEIKPGLTRLV